MDSETKPAPETETKTPGDSPPEEVAENSQPGPAKRVRNRPRRAIIAAALGLGVIGLLQWFATSTDHANANAASIAVGVVTAICVTFQLHCGID